MVFAVTEKVKSVEYQVPSIFVSRRPNSWPTGRSGTNRRVTSISPLSCRSFVPGTRPILRRYARASGTDVHSNGRAVSNPIWPLVGTSIVDTGTEGASVKAISVNIQIVFTLERARA